MVIALLPGVLMAGGARGTVVLCLPEHQEGQRIFIKKFARIMEERCHALVQREITEQVCHALMQREGKYRIS
jgi:hypothetical protein